MSKKITRITVETEQIVIISPQSISPQSHPVEAWCEGCSAFVRIVTPEQAALLTHISARTIYHQAEAGEVHFTKTPEGLLFICLNSIKNKQHQSKFLC